MPKTKEVPTADQGYVVYPRALLHQKAHRETEFDMEMNMQPAAADLNPGDYGSHAPGKYHDVIETIVHELLHGLGIFSYINKQIAKPAYTGPFPRTVRTSRTAHSVMFLKSVFDTHLHSQKGPLLQLIRSMDLQDRPTAEVNAFIEAIPAMDQIHQINELLTTEESLYFVTSSNKLIVQTGRGQGDVRSRLSHLSNTDYRVSLDHMMIPGAMPYAFLIRDKEKIQHWQSAPIGNNTVDLLVTLGYRRSLARRERSQLAFYDEMRKHTFKPGDREYIYYPKFP